MWEHKCHAFIVFEMREASWDQDLTSRRPKKHNVLSPGSFWEHSGALQGLHGLARCVQKAIGNGLEVLQNWFCVRISIKVQLCHFNAALVRNCYFCRYVLILGPGVGQPRGPE